MGIDSMVKVYPQSAPEKTAIGRVAIYSRGCSIQILFDDNPPFVSSTSGVSLLANKVVLMAYRLEDDGPWIEVFGLEHFTIEEIVQ